MDNSLMCPVSSSWDLGLHLPHWALTHCSPEPASVSRDRAQQRPAKPLSPLSQLVVDSDKNTVLVPDLKPNTKYFFTVQAIYPDAPRESMTVKGKTSESVLGYVSLILHLCIGV